MSNAYSVPVLMYHHVVPAHGRISVTTRRFAQQMAGLARAGYTSLTAAQFAGYLAGEPVPRKSVLITFDDGYLDNWVHAHPILKHYGMHAVLFLVTGWIGNGPVRPQAGQDGPLPDTPDHAACSRLIAGGRPDAVMLRWSEVQAMQADGTFEFHSHTHTHIRWDKRHGEDAAAKRASLAQDLADSRQALAERLGTASDHLCWPQGYFDADYVDVAQAAGFRHLYTTDAFGQNRPGNPPRHIYRMSMRNGDLGWFNPRLWWARNALLGPHYLAWRAWKRSRRK